MSQTSRAESVVRPFRALRYDSARVDPADVVSPPYDVIDEAERLELLARSPYNVVRLILPGAGHESEAAETLDRWTSEGILVREPRPSAWWLEQEATGPDGVRRRRSGLIATVRVDAYGEGAVRPHERTLDGPKAGRLALMRAVGANLSPIFAIYDDPASTVTSLVDAFRGAAPPLIDVRDGDGTDHRLWRIDDDDVLEAISVALAPLSLVIADGHHRYETAMTYRAERRAADGDPDGERPYDFAPVYLANKHDPGLQPFATHRVITGIDPVLAAALPESLAADWRVQEVAGGVDELERAVAAAPRGVPAFGLWDGTHGRLLTLRDAAIAAAALPGASPATQALDVAVLGALVLGRALGIDAGAVAVTDRIRYRRRAAEAAELVAAEPPGSAVALLLRAPTVAEVEAVAAAGETMPQKSTYFFPKLLDGLVFHPLDA
ncbi:MAG: DUF1015 domain-containing protein [Gaiellales bacterium]